jgi:hypothetical protein
MDAREAGSPLSHEEWYQQRRDQIIQAFLQAKLDEDAATHHLLALRLELLRLRQVEQTFGPLVAEAVRDNVELPVAAAEAPLVCSSCGASGAATVLPVFEVSRLAAVTWRLCAPCWRHLTIGFTALRPGDDLGRYCASPPFCLTDTELRGYIAASRTVIGRKRKRS